MHAWVLLLLSGLLGGSLWAEGMQAPPPGWPMGAPGGQHPLQPPMGPGGPAPQAWVTPMRAPLPMPVSQPTPASRVPLAEPQAPRGLDPAGSRTEPLDLKSFPTPQAKRAASPSAPLTPPLASHASADYAAMGSLLDQLAQDERSLRALLAAHPGAVEAWSPADHAQFQALLKRRDTTEELLQAHWGEHPLPRPAATPSSARPYATRTPLP